MMILIDISSPKKYNRIMKRILFEYFSNNGIRLHHFLYVPDETQTDIEDAKSHNAYKLLLQLRGTSHHFIDGTKHLVQGMQMCVLPPNSIHSIEIIPKEDCESITLHFSPNLLPPFQDKTIFSSLNDSALYNHIIPLEYIEEYKIKKLFDTIISTAKRHDEYTELEIVIQILKISKRLSEIINNPIFQQNIPTPTKRFSLSYYGIQYIKEHLTENITVEDIASSLHVSASHFRQAFKKELGVTLHHYIFEQKMQLAFKLLSQGETPLNVSNKLGYEYYSTFYHHYMKRFQVAPKLVFIQVDKQRTFGEELKKRPQKPTKK